jgi:DNA-binding response OmpR family regulator
MENAAEHECLAVRCFHLWLAPRELIRETMRKKPAVLASTGFSREFSLRDWKIRPALNELEREGKVCRIEGRSMAVLVELAQRGNVLSSKRRLIEAVWGNAAWVPPDPESFVFSWLR